MAKSTTTTTKSAFIDFMFHQGLANDEEVNVALMGEGTVLEELTMSGIFKEVMFE